MAEKTTLSEGFISSGLALLGYDWIYVPLLRVVGVEPWSITATGVFMLCTGMILTLIHIAWTSSRDPTE